MLLCKPLEIAGRHQLRKTISRFVALQDAVCDESADHRGFYAQQCPGLAVVEKSFGWHSDARHWPILTQLFAMKEVSSNPREPFGIADRHKIAIDNGTDYGGKSGIAAEVVFESMTKRDERPGF